MSQVLEGRLYSEGLHVLGAAPSSSATAQFLSAYMGDRLPQEVVESLAVEGIQAARGRLEAAFAAPAVQGGGEAKASAHAALLEAQEVAQLLALNTQVCFDSMSRFGCAL